MYVVLVIIQSVGRKTIINSNKNKIKADTAQNNKQISRQIKKQHKRFMAKEDGNEREFTKI